MLELNWIEKAALAVMREGHVPEHIAFIMDGNRRFAKHKQNAALSGHQEGAFTLKKCLLYCLQLGVKCASFYAFSIENYRRAPEQVQFLMDLARSQFRQLSQLYEQDNILDLIEKNNVRVIIAGDLDGKLKEKFPDVREGFLKIQERTAANSRMTMYLCFAYDSIHEYNAAVEAAEAKRKTQELTKKEQKQDQEPEQQKLKERTVDDRKAVFQGLMVPRHIDVLVRTSGESRLSNYMLMQVNYGMIFIEKGFWPSFSMTTLAKILLQYNYHYHDIRCKRLKLAPS